MSYIIPITLFSVLILLLTTIKKVSPAESEEKRVEASGKHHSKNSKKGYPKKHLSIDGAAFSNIIQQIVIVFLSALLAMSLTEYVEDKMNREQAAALMPQLQNSIITQFSKVGGEIKDIYDVLEEGETATDEQLLNVAKVIVDEDGAFMEAILYNENLVSTVAPMSYMFLNMDVSQMKKISSDLSEIDPENFDRQKTAELIAEYLYCCTDAAFSMEVLKEDITFDLVTLAMVEESVLKDNVYYELYTSYIEKLQTAFSVDLKSYEGKIRYGVSEGIE